MSGKPQSSVRVAEQHRRELLARQGLRFPAIILRQLRNAGIYCQPTVSIGHQQWPIGTSSAGLNPAEPLPSWGVLELHRGRRERARLASTRGHGRRQWCARHRGCAGARKDRDAGGFSEPTTSSSRGTASKRPARGRDRDWKAPSCFMDGEARWKWTFGAKTAHFVAQRLPLSTPAAAKCLPFLASSKMHLHVSQLP